MAKSSEVVLGHCHKTAALGNKISIRMLEFLSTSEHLPHGFEDMAREFLDICRIMSCIEAGITQCNRTHQKLPADMAGELEKKLKSTQSDFQVLDQILGRYLEYERRGTVGKIQRGWRKMFEANDIDKIRGSLGQTRESLKISSLFFQWTLGDANIEETVGIGYTGLAAALDRLSLGKMGPEKPRPPVVQKPPHDRELPPDGGLAGARQDQMPLQDDAASTTPRDNGHSLPPILPLPDIGRHHSFSNYTNSTIGRRDSTIGATNVGRETMSSQATRNSPHSAEFWERGDDDQRVLSRAEPGTPNTEVDPSDASVSGKVVHIKANPANMPRWTPRSIHGAETPSLQASLVAAVKDRNHRMVEQLLDRGVSPESSGSGTHVLREAILHHDIETIRLLLLFGADPNAPDGHGATPLFAAVEESFLDGANLLLKYGADPNLVAGPDPESNLAVSIVEDKIHFARLLLTYGGDANHIMTNGDTLLIKAISRKRSRSFVELLLDYGSDPNGKNEEGTTPLFEAIQSNRIEIVQALLDHGANPNLPGPKHMLWPATSKPACLQLLLARGADHKKTPGVMELATSINKMESVRLLLKAGADPNAKKDGVWTPLCTSIRDNRADIFQLLLTSGADPNVPSAEFPAFKCVTHFRPQYLAPLVSAGADLHTPKGIIEQAVQSNNSEALRWLLDAGVSPNDKAPKTGATPLTTAIRENRVDVVELLLARGADPNVRGQDWPICMAVRQPHILKRLLPALAEPRAYKGVVEQAVVANQLESVKLLLAAGVSVEDRNGGVFSPLTTAIRERRRDIVEFLLDEGGADPNAPGEHLPVVKALRRLEAGNTEILEMLLAKGADPNKVYRGHNGIIQALENGDAAILKLLVDRCGVDLNARDDTDRTVAQIAAARGWSEATAILLQESQSA